MPLYYAEFDPECGLGFEADTPGQAKKMAMAEWGGEFINQRVYLAREMVCLKHERPMVYWVPVRRDDDECGYCSGKWWY